MLPKRLLAIAFAAALAAMGGRVARAQWWVLPANALTSMGSDIYAGISASTTDPNLPWVDGVYRSTDQGASWSGIGVKHTTVYALALSGGNLITSAGLYTKDSGKTWKSTIGLDGAMAFCVKDSTLFACAYGIFRSTDHGANWQRIFLDTTILANGFYSIASNGSDIFAGGDSHYGSTGIYRSTDNGVTWTNIGPDSRGVLAIAVMGSKLIVGAFGDLPGDILISSDTGRTWVSKLSVDATSFAQSGSHLFAGTSHQGILVSNDTGETWSNLALIDTPVNALAVSGNYLVAGTALGIFPFAISDLIARSGVTVKSMKPAIVSVYPNPVSHSSTVSFTSETASYASVSIVNPLGTEVARLFSGELSPGEHQFRWSNPAVPNGMYECVVRMNGRVQQAGLVLMR